jgi:hypothetical protein
MASILDRLPATMASKKSASIHPAFSDKDWASVLTENPPSAGISGTARPPGIFNQSIPAANK